MSDSSAAIGDGHPLPGRFGDDLVAVWLVVGVAAVLLCSIPNPAVGYERYAVVKELVASAAILGAALAARRRTGAFSLSVPTWTALAVCLVGSLVAAGSSFGLQWNGVRETGTLVGMLAAFELARILGAAARRHVLVGIVAAVSVCSAVVLAEAAGVIPPMSLPGRGPGGLMGNRNFAAELSVLGVIAATALSRWTPRRHRVNGMDVALATCGAAVMVSRGRTAMIGLAVALLVTLVSLHRTRERGRYRCAGTILLGAALGAALSVLVWSPSAVRSTLGSLTEVDRGTGHGRLVQARTTGRILAGRHGLGVGTGNWAAAYSLARGTSDSTFNAQSVEPVGRLPSSDWVNLTADLGPLGALIIIAWLGAHLWPGRRRVSGADDYLNVRWAIVLCVAVMGIGDAVLMQAQGALIVATLLGVLAPQQRDGRHRAEVAHAPSTESDGDRSLAGKATRRRLRVLGTGLLLAVPLIGSVIVTAREAMALAFFAPELDADTMVRLATVAPGLYFLHVYAAGRLGQAHRCQESAAQARLADDMMPGRPIIARMTAACHPLTRAEHVAGSASGIVSR